MKKLIAKIIVSTTLIATNVSPLLAKDVATTPYKHIPVDTFIGGFPSEAFIMIGIIAYFVGVVYIFNAVLLRESVK